MEGSWLMEGNFTPTMSPTEEPECDASGLEDADNKCDFVKSYCGDVVTLIDYMQIFYCTSGGHGMRAILTFVLVVWLVLLISLLATTADYYFVPPLEYLSFSMLKLSPEVAGITLLALGNGAPDVFGALAGINGQDDFQVVLGALLGASIFISSVVLGSVLLAAPTVSVDKETFRRDVFAYLVTVVIIVGIAHDGNINIFETIGLLFFYVIYVAIVVIRSRMDARAADRQRSIASSAPHLTSAEQNGVMFGHSPLMNGDDDEGGRLSLTSSAVSVSVHGRVIVGKLEEDPGDEGSGAYLGPAYVAPGAGEEGGDMGLHERHSERSGVDLLGKPLRATSGAGGAHAVIRGKSTDRTSSKSLASTHQRSFSNERGEAPPALAGLEWPSLDLGNGEDAGRELSTLELRGGQLLVVCFMGQVLLELPFTLIRWASCPSVDQHWDLSRRIVAVLSPMGFLQILLLDAFGFDGFTMTLDGTDDGFPVWALMFILGFAVSTAVYFATAGSVEKFEAYRAAAAAKQKGRGTLQTHSSSNSNSNGDYRYSEKASGQPSSLLNDPLLLPSSGVMDGTRGSVSKDGFLQDENDQPPLPKVYPFLTLLAFASSVVWMDLIANEAVSLMESLGVMLGISTSILGLTVLALGNSVGDLIADLAVAKAGQSRMAISTCFGSPLLNDILGLGIALLLTTAKSYPNNFHGSISTPLYIAWVFLATSLISSIVVFHFYSYHPPRKFAYWLFFLYFVFLVVSICFAVGVM